MLHLAASVTIYVSKYELKTMLVLLYKLRGVASRTAQYAARWQ